MKLIQITDPHIGVENEKPYDVDVRYNFRKLLDALGNEDFDHLVLSGDLCYREPDEDIYYWVKSQMDALTSYYSVISGNHDDNQMINKIFYREKSSRLYYSKHIQDRTIYLLDSGPGKVDQHQLAWLEEKLTLDNTCPIIFMHHPPAICQVPHMDGQHHLQNYHEVQSFIGQYPMQFHFFCGHYHLEKTISLQNMHIHITPSSFFQIDDRYEDFVIGSYQVGYRRIFVDDNRIFTSVKYLDHKNIPRN